MTKRNEYLWNPQATPNAEICTLERALAQYRKPLKPLQMTQSPPHRRKSKSAVLPISAGSNAHVGADGISPRDYDNQVVESINRPTTSPVTPAADFEAVFLSYLPTVERVVGALARRQGLSADAADEFSAWAKLKLVEKDYAVIAKFRGESSPATYLTVVLAMLFREYRVAEWGRWRPSAAARRHSLLAVRLETMLLRDNISLGHAGEALRTAGATSLTDRQLAEVAGLFPPRLRLRAAESEEVSWDIPGSSRADEKVEADEGFAETLAAKRALLSALDTLPDDERLIVRMHYIDGMSVAEIARALSIPQKPLYRKLDRARGRLRAQLESLGISRDAARQVLSIELACGR